MAENEKQKVKKEKKVVQKFGCSAKKPYLCARKNKKSGE